MAKGIQPNTDSRNLKTTWTIAFNGGAPIKCGEFWPSEESALAWACIWLAHLKLDGYDLSRIFRPLTLNGLVGGTANNFGSKVFAHVQASCPNLNHDQCKSVCARAACNRHRLVGKSATSTTYVKGLDKLELASKCYEAEAQCAVAMMQRVHCVGPPGVHTALGPNICPHAHLRSDQLDVFSLWQRVDYDHGPYAEMSFISSALSGLLLSSQGSLAQLCWPLLRHLLYSTEWGVLQTEGGGTVQIGPNLAPRCSRRTILALVGRGGAQAAEVPPIGGSCHGICGKGWAAELVLNRNLLGSMTLLQLNAAVLRSSPSGADIISEAALAFIKQYNTVYGILCLTPFATAFPPTVADLPKWLVSGGVGLPKLVAAALIIHLQQAVAIDIAQAVGLLCCLLSAALPLSWCRARALLSGLCFARDILVLFVCACLVGGMGWLAVASRVLAAASLVLRVWLPPGWLAAMHGRTYRLAVLFYMASTVYQLESVGAQPWDVLLPALMRRIAVKVTTYLCLEWLSGYTARRALHSPLSDVPLASSMLL